MENIHSPRSDCSDLFLNGLDLDLEDPLAGEEDHFAPPILEDDHPAVTLFLNYFPAISQLPNIPILNQTRAYQFIAENVDVISVTVVVSSIGITAIAGIGVFFMSAGTIKLVFFSIQCGSGFIAIISTGGYAKKYLFLRRIQQEVEVLRIYREETGRQILALEEKNNEFQASITDLQGEVQTFQENNGVFATANAQLQVNLEAAETLCVTLRQNKELEEKKYQVLFGQQEEANSELQASLLGANQILDGITTERQELQDTNTSLSGSVEKLRAAVRDSEDRFKTLETANTELSKFYTKLTAFKAEFEKEKSQRTEFQKENQQLRKKLESDVDKLSTLEALLSYETNRLTGIRENLEETNQEFLKRNEELIKRNSELEESACALAKLPAHFKEAAKGLHSAPSANAQQE